MTTRRIKFIPSTYCITQGNLACTVFETFLSIFLLQTSYNTRVVLLGALSVGIASGLLGAFLQLYRRALLGDAISHAAFPGIIIAFIIGNVFFGLDKVYFLLLTGAVCSAGFGLCCIYFLREYTHVTDEASLGIVLSVFFGAGVLLLSYVQELPEAAAAGLQHFIYGHTASMRSVDATVSCIVSTLSIFLVCLCKKELMVIAFDKQFAFVQGLPVSLIDSLYLSILLILTIVGFQSVGLLLMVAMLIIPAATARLWTDRASPYFILSSFLGGSAAYTGSVLSATFADFPTGAMIVLVASTMFFISAVCSPKSRLWNILTQRFYFLYEDRRHREP